MILTHVFSRIDCLWHWRWLTPAAWSALPHVTAVSLALVCVGIPPAYVPPPPLPPVGIIVPPPLFPPSIPFVNLPPAWTHYAPPEGGMPPATWHPAGEFLPRGDDIASLVPSSGANLPHATPVGGEAPELAPPQSPRVVDAPEPGIGWMEALVAIACLGLRWRRS